MLLQKTSASTDPCLCFPQVKMAFSKERALPGSTLRMGLEASPGSLCAIRAVDRSVLLLKPEAELSMAEVGSPKVTFSPLTAPWTEQD